MGFKHPRRPDYNRLPPNCVLAADALATADGSATILMYNHSLDRAGQPQGMNLLLGDGHVQWQDNSGGFELYFMSAGQIFWHYAHYTDEDWLDGLVHEGG